MYLLLQSKRWEPVAKKGKVRLLLPVAAKHLINLVVKSDSLWSSSAFILFDIGHYQLQICTDSPATNSLLIYRRKSVLVCLIGLQLWLEHVQLGLITARIYRCSNVH